MCGFVLLMDDPSSTIVGFFCTFFFCQNAPFQISIASKSKRRRTCGVREFSATVEQTSAFYCLFWNDAAGPLLSLPSSFNTPFGSEANIFYIPNLAYYNKLQS
ncbi:unnamed protein product, partial [Vitis vinifera]